MTTSDTNKNGCCEECIERYNYPEITTTSQVVCGNKNCKCHSKEGVCEKCGFLKLLNTCKCNPQGHKEEKNTTERLGKVREEIEKREWKAKETVRQTQSKKKNMWTVKLGHHLFILHNGEVIYKSTRTKSGKKKQPSVLFNKDWPNEEII